MDDQTRFSRTLVRFLLTTLIGSIVVLGSTGSTASEGVETGGISGKVLDESGEPVPHAAVLILAKQIGGFADSTGTFTIRNVPTGTYTVRAIGRAGRCERTNVAVAAATTTTVDFILTRPEDSAPVFTGAYEPCDYPEEEVDPDKASLVQIGVHSEKRGATRIYIYKVLNRSSDPITEVRVGYDGRRGRCELTGASPHAVPDTAFGPPGWICAPVQGDDSAAFAVSWKVAPGGIGIPPRSSSSGFSITLRTHDELYSGCHWLAGTGRRFRNYGGTVRPEREVDAISMETGTITGRVTDQTGAFIAGATVVAWHRGVSVASTPDGAYTLSAVPVGEFTMMAQKTGYQPCAKNHVSVAANETTRVDFHLSTREVSIPCTAYSTPREGLDTAFPQRAVDTRGSVQLDRSAAVPRRTSGDGSRPRPFIYSLTDHDIEIVYRGLGEDTATRAFVATVRREFRNPMEERLLRIAEAIHPPTKVVVSVADDRLDRKALLKEKRLWWFGEFDGVRLPFAVTGDAVRYYLTLTQALGQGDSTQTHGIRMTRSKFSYSASVGPGPQTFKRGGRVFENVIVVTMSLVWSDYCGSLCACGFSLDRTVLLRPDGTLVCVFGDRKPNVIVS